MPSADTLSRRLLTTATQRAAEAEALLIELDYYLNADPLVLR